MPQADAGAGGGPAADAQVGRGGGGGGGRGGALPGAARELPGQVQAQLGRPLRLPHRHLRLLRRRRRRHPLLLVLGSTSTYPPLAPSFSVFTLARIGSIGVCVCFSSRMF